MLIVEDGTGKSDAQSYCSVAFADSYFSVRGVSEWAGTPSEKESFLVEATEFLDLRWARLLNGSLQFPETQGLLFPRKNAFDTEGRTLVGITESLKRATAEYALVFCKQANSSPTGQPIGEPGKVLIEQATDIGPIRTTKKYQVISTSAAISSMDGLYGKADSLMSVFINRYSQTIAYV